MNNRAEINTLYWRMVNWEYDDERLVKTWNVLFGIDYSNHASRVNQFIKEARSKGITRFQSQHVKKHLQDDDDEDEQAEISTVTSNMFTDVNTTTTDDVTRTPT